jgi:hypothetical protein
VLFDEFRRIVLAPRGLEDSAGTAISLHPPAAGARRVDVAIGACGPNHAGTSSGESALITLSRLLARQFRVLLRRSLQPPGPRDPPLVLLRASREGLELAARHPECCLLYRQPGSLPAETLVFPADVLTDVEGKAGSVTLVGTGAGQAEARWDDGGVPRRRPFATVLPDKLPELPELPTHFQPVEPAFLQALAEAARTCARESGHYALARIQLRGRSGQLVATDGRQLLVQGGFALPWPEELLIPALPVFVSRGLPSEGAIALGRTATQVGVRIGSWTLLLEIDTEGRYPHAEGVIPRGASLASRLELSEDDARFLAHVLPRLPGGKDDFSSVTLDLGAQVVLRTRADEAQQVHEVVLSGSSCAGPSVRLACNRRYVGRLVQLGFRDVLLGNATTPLLCRDPTRTYLFMVRHDA